MFTKIAMWMVKQQAARIAMLTMGALHTLATMRTTLSMGSARGKCAVFTQIAMWMAEQVAARIAMLAMSALQTLATIQTTPSMGSARGSCAVFTKIAMCMTKQLSTRTVILTMGALHTRATIDMTLSIRSAHEARRSCAGGKSAFDTCRDVVMLIMAVHWVPAGIHMTPSVECAPERAGTGDCFFFGVTQAAYRKG